MALNFRKFLEGLRVIPKTTSTVSEKGDLDVTDSSGKLNYHNGTSASPLVSEAHSATLTNKTIDGDDNTIQDIAITSLKTVLADANKVIRRDAAGAVISGNALPNSSEIATVDATQTLTNKTLTSPILNTPTADTITGITGGALTVQSASNQNLVIQAQGSGQVSLASLTAVTSKLALNAQTDAATTGSNATVATPTKSYIQLTNGSLASVDGIPAGGDGQIVVLSNRTGNSVVVNNETGGTAANRVLTGTGGAISLDNNASLTLLYNTTASRWMIVGGVGGSLVVNLTAGETLAVGNAVYVSQGAADGGRTAGQVYKLDATNDNRIDFIGFALDASTASNPVRVQVGGGLGGFSGLAAGLPVYASVATPGATQNTAPTVGGQWIIQVGTATSTTALVINGAGGATAIEIADFSGAYLNRSSVSINTTLTNNNDVVLVNAGSGAINITLPTPSDGKLFHVKKVDFSANIVSVLPSAAELIDGASSKTLTGQYDSVEVISDGTNWFIL